jgi:hypothetical protein
MPDAAEISRKSIDEPCPACGGVVHEIEKGLWSFGPGEHTRIVTTYECTSGSRNHLPWGWKPATP